MAQEQQPARAGHSRPSDSWGGNQEGGGQDREDSSEPGKGPGREPDSKPDKGNGSRRGGGYKDPRKTAGAALVTAALAAVPALTLLGQRLLAVLWLATGMLVLAAFRLRRPEERWLGARGRVFDVVFASVLAGVIFALAQYVNLPRVR